jgi:hypothetical protein
VALATATSGAAIYYTLDGSTPTAASTLYSGPIAVLVTQTIKAIAVKATFIDSSISSFPYTITGAVQAPTFSVAGGSYGPAQALTLSTATPGATIYYTTNGSDPTSASMQYTGPINISSSQTIKAFAALTNWDNSGISSAAYTINGAAEAPAFSVAAGAYGPAQSVALSTSTSGATIYYTTDGSLPTTTSTTYSTPINVSSSMTIKAIATKSNFIDSSVASASYTINGAVATPTFSVAEGAYGPAQSVALSTATAGATIYYTTDGSAPTTSSAVYSAAINVTSSMTIKAFATKANFSDSAIATAAYTINGAVAAPTFSVAPGAYGPTQSVALSTTTAGATIHYTTDGSNPTAASSVYSTAISVASSMTIKAYAVKATFSDSAVASASYTINGTVSAPTFSVAAGAYGVAQSVVLSSATPGAVVYYSTDGSEPTASSNIYLAPVVVANTTTIKAYAVRSTFSDSPVATADYTINGAVASPTASPAAGIYTTAQSVALSSSTSGANIYYTLDGSAPTIYSNLYSAPVFVGVSQTIKAIAVKATFADSSVATFTYTINGTVQAPTFSLAAGAYGPAQTVTLASSTPGSTIYYTTDGSTPTQASSQYSGPITVATSQTIKAYAVLTNWADSPVSSAAYTINGSAAAPTFSVAAGAYGPAQSVALSSATAGAAIYYTTDGSTPTTSSNAYAAPINVTSSMTIKAFAAKATFSDSVVASSIYTINGPAAAPTFSVPAGAYGVSQLVSLSSATPSATIYYTLDGSNPTTASSVYASAINVTATTTIKAIATKADFLDSTVATAAYTINGAVATPTFSVAAGAYGIAQTVALSSASVGATIYYTTDDSTPTAASSMYLTPIVVSSTSTIKAFAVRSTYADSAVASATYTINGSVEAPVASPVAGTYTSAQSVSLTSATSGASIYYTLDGSTPTIYSMPYTAPLFVGVSQTVKAIAAKATYSDSIVASFAYAITGTVQAPTFSVAAGAYGPAQTVALSSTTPGATIYYTIDGSAPTTSSSVYSSPITVSTSRTIKAYAVLANWADSLVSSANYTINGAVATPTFSVAAGAYGPTQSVTLSSATPGATIYYTTDGSTPTNLSNVYSSAINVANSMTIKAFAVKADFSDSAVATAAYTINGAVATPTFSVAAGAYGPAQSVSLSTTTAGATIYYTIDGSTPTTSSNVYTSAINVSTSMTIKAFATKSAFSDSAIATATYTINGAVATPTFSVASGAYGPAQSVTLSSTTSGATIYYTTDGSAPTTASTVYSAAINVASSMTIKAFAVKSTFTDSAVASSSYTINGPVATPTFSVAAGSYGPSQSVSLSTATAGAIIYYTTDGSTPTTASTVYSAAINVASSMTIKTFATKANFSDSAVASAAYTINGAASAPTASPAAGIYTSAQSITLASATTGASIYYTVDGSTPTTSSTLYSAPVFVGVSQTVKAIASKASYSDSSVASFAYTITGTVQAPTFSVAAGSYGPAQSVTLNSTTPGATIYYTTNGSSPTTSSTQYTGPITVSSSQTIKAYAVLSNWADSPVASATYTINGAVATPTFSVPSGAYGSAQSVSISTTTIGSTIYFTTDGSTPTTSSSIYSTPISVSSSATIKAFAVRSTYADSAVGSATYTINGVLAAPTASPVAGIYTSAQSVTLSSSTSGASIYYTVDGTTPTIYSSLYSAPVFVGVNQTIKAMAVKATYGDSTVASFAYTITGTVQAPTFSVAGGAYGPAQTVALASATPGSTIYYTTNGTTPSTASTQYTGPITVSTSQTIKAFAVLTNWADSVVSTADYTINGAVATPTFSVAAGAYGPAQSVVLSTTTSGATIYYTTDGTTPTTLSNVYSTAINVSSSMTIKTYAVKATFSDSAVATAAYTINGAVATPTFSLAAGAYGPAQSVALSTATTGATIYYTTDGSTPTTASNVYSAAINVSSSMTIKTYAVKANFSDSSVATAAYTINGAVSTPTFSVAAGAYGPAQSVVLSTATSGATIYYTTDGTTPTTSSSVYSAAINVSSSMTIKAYAVKSTFSDSALATAAYTINGAVATPTFSVAAGAYGPAQSVVLSTATSGATIYYTTDGTAPTTSSNVYSTAINVSSSMTIKAYAVKSTFSDSAVATATYTINGAVAAPNFSVAAGTYGPAQSVVLSTATTGATIYYTTDGTTPTTSSTVYSSAISVASSMTIKAYAVKATFSDSSIATAAYTINGAVATPTFTPAAGTYGSSQAVTISSATSESTIYYTTDGSTPTTSSSVYSTGISVSASQTLKAFAAKAGFTNSAVGSADYVIDTVPPGITAASITSSNPGTSLTPSIGFTSSEAGTAMLYSAAGCTSGSVSSSLPLTVGSNTMTANALSTNTTTTLYVKVADALGNSSCVLVGSYTHDNTAPLTPVIADVTKSFNASFTTSVQQGVPADANFKDFRYTTNGADPTCSSGTASSSQPLSISIAAATTTIKVVSCDLAGNSSSIASSIYTYDTTPPNSPTVTGVTPSNVRPTWTWTSGGGGGNGTYRFKLNSIDLTAGATQTTTTSYQPTTDLTGGTHTLYVQERDAAGNWSTSGSFAIVVDATAPNAPLVTSMLNPISSSAVTWTWGSGGGGGNGTFRYKLDSNDFTSGSTTTTQAAFTAYALANGAHTLYVQEVDGFGNWSASGSYAVTVNIPATGPYVIAGTGSSGYSGDGGLAVYAELTSALDVAVNASGDLFIADYSLIRKIAPSTGVISTYAPMYLFNNPAGITADIAGDIYVADSLSNVIYKISAIDESVSTYAGTGFQGNSGDNGLADTAELNSPTTVAFGADGNLLILDAGNGTVRKVDKVSKIIVTIAGGGSSSEDNVPATQVGFADLKDMAVAPNGDIYIAESAAEVGRIRKISAVTGLVTTVAGGNGIATDSGNGGQSRQAGIQNPNSIAIDSLGNILVGNAYGLRKIEMSSGIISSVYSGIEVSNLAFGPSKHLYATSLASNQVYKFNHINEVDCSDGIDNDGDGQTDLADSECKTVLDLTFDGVDGSTDFKDISPYGNSVTKTGSVQISTDHSKYGGSSAYFSGGYLTIPANSAFGIGTGDFTVEFWERRAVSGGPFYGLFNLGTYANGILLRDGSSTDSLYLAGASQDWDPDTRLQNNTWHHVALVRNAGIVNLYVDGVKAVNNWSRAISLSANDIIIGASAHATPEYFTGYIDNLKVSRNSSGGAVAAPTYSLAAGGYGPAQSVSLSSPTSGATIFYTTDGNIPSTDSAIYTAAIDVSETMTIKAIAVKPNFIDSPVSSAAYTINGPASTPTFSVASGAYGPTQSVAISTATVGATIYYTTNGTTPTTASSVYSSAISVGSSMTIKAIAVMAGFSNSSEASANYTINGAVATPTFSPGSGTYGSARTVTISSTTAGANIYYTTDGSAPTTASPAYSTGVTVSASLTLKAMATKAGFSNSAVGSAAYVIDTVAPVITAASITSTNPSGSQLATAAFTSNESGTSMLYSSAGCSTGAVSASSSLTVGSNTMTTSSLTANSTTAIYVKATDTVGNSSCTLIGNYTHDNTAPLTPVIGSATRSFNSAFSTNIQQNIPPDATFKEFRYTLDGTNPTCSTGVASSAQPTSVSIPAASTTLKAVACDNVGLASGVATSVYTFDNAAPTVTITSTTSAVTSVSPIPVTITFSESVTGFTSSSMTATNGTLSGFSGSGATYNVNLTPSAQGSVSIALGAGVSQDAAGNGNNAAATFSRTFDSVVPTLSALSVQSSSPSTTNFAPTVAFTLSESATVTLYSDVSCSTAISSASSKSSGAQTMTTNALPDSAVTSIYIKGVDAATNASSCSLIGSYTTQLPALALSTPTRGVTQLGHSWTTATGATYNIYWSTTAGVTTSSTVLTGVSQTYWHTGLTGGTTYYYKIAAVKNGVVGVLSNEVSGVPYIGTVATPTVTPTGGTYNRRQMVAMSTTTIGASIRYTTNGTTPNCSTSTLYTASFRIWTTQTIQAIACLTNYADSSMASSDYTMNIRSQAISFAPNSGHNIEVTNISGGASMPVEIDIQAVGGEQIHHRWVVDAFGVCQWNGSSCYTWEYLWDGVAHHSNLTCNGTSSSPNYNNCRDNGSLTISNGQKLRFAFGSRLDLSYYYYGRYALYRNTPGAAVNAIVYVGSASGQVTVWKTSWEDVNNVNAGTASYTISAANSVSAPNFDPDGGTYNVAQSVSISSATAGATIYYTTDGSNPNTTSSVYSTPLNINSSVTVKAYAVKSGLADSAVTSVSYVIDTVAPSITAASITTSNPSGSQTPSVAFTSNETGTAMLYSAAGCSTGAISSSVILNSGSNTLTTNTLTANATTAIYVKATDAVGNALCTLIGSYTHDNTAPLAPVIATATRSFNVAFSTTIQQNIPADATFKEFRYTLNGTTPTCSTGTASSAQPMSVSIPAATTSLNVIACDNAGLSSTVSTAVYTFDNVAPTVTITSTASSTTNVSPIPVTITFSEVVTGFASSSMTVTNGSLSGFSGSGSTYTTSVTPTAQGAVSVSIAAGLAQDAAGNGNTAATTLSRTFDSLAPSFSAMSVQSTSPSSTNFTPTVAFTLSEAATIRLYSDSGCTTSLSASTSLTSGAKTMTTNTLPDSAQTSIYIQGVDSVPNTSACTLIGSYITQLPAATLATPIRYVTSLGLSWSSVTGATSYYMYWSTTAGVTTASNVLLGVTSIYTHTPLTGGTTYYYRVAPVKNGVIGALSNETSGVPYSYPAPTISAISPNAGSSAGGTSVTIMGTGFVSGATVTIGGASATAVTVTSSTTLTAITPAGTAGIRNVVVSNSDGQSATLSSGFTYMVPVEYLVVGGGGGGGSNIAGGGGAGGFRTDTNYLVSLGDNYTVTVGTGGAGGAGGVSQDGKPGAKGGDSVFDTVISAGGGGGAGNAGAWAVRAGSAGGSGGGGAHSGAGYAGNTPATTPVQGYKGGNGKSFEAPGGGGGAGGAGSNGTSNGGNGGPGLSSSITGVALMYAGGGGGGDFVSAAGTGGSGVGGNGGNSAAGGAGTANRGGGGGGGGYNYSAGGAGGSGVVIIAYPSTVPALVDITGTLTYNVDTATRAGYRVYRFTGGTGTIEWPCTSNCFPSIASVSPNIGSAAGGTAITITGTGFVSGATVSIGGAAATGVTVVSSSTITATTSAGTIGAQNVVVTNPDNQSVTLSSGFSYRIPADVLVVAGGGGGGTGRAGGGGAGGLIYQQGITSIASGIYSLTVGDGGAGSSAIGVQGSNGNNSSIGALLVAAGGGGGGSATSSISIIAPRSGVAGGSGGGASFNFNTTRPVGGAGTAGQGNNGGSSNAGSVNDPRNTGGGGGAGGVGITGNSSTTAPNGGVGLAISITGVSTYYAGGGGGSSGEINGEPYTTANSGTGGLGGGGNGATSTVALASATNGAANTGGGGGGGISYAGGNGGSGVVIIAYPSTYPEITAIDATLSYTVDTSTRAGYRVYRFTGGTGNITWP